MSWVCRACSNTIEDEAQVCTVCGAARPRAGSLRGAAASRDWGMEAHLRALAIWYRLGGVLAVIVALIFGFKGGGAMSGAGPLAQLGIALAVLMGLLGAAYCVLGELLARYWNAARIISAGLTILQMVGNLYSMVSAPGGGSIVGGLIGLAWYGAIAWALLNGRSSAICTAGYRDLVARSPSLKPPTFKSPFFWIPLVLICLGIALVVALFGMFAAGGSRGF